ncbi:MAG: sensor histidine kinase [Pseudomonadales bacterium]
MTESTQFSKSKAGISLKRRDKSKKRTSFRQQLFSIFAGCGLTIAVAAAIAYAYSTTQYLRELYVSQALQATENFAELSELALLYESGENAQDAASATLSFPSIKFVSVVSSDDKVLLEEGLWDGNRIAVPSNKKLATGAELLGSKSQAWHFWAPVYSDTEEGLSIAGDRIASSEYVGYVYVVEDQQEFIVAEYEIFRKNILIGLLGGLMFILVLHFLLNRLLAPMNRLALVMEKTREGDTSVRAIPSGPSEIVDMAEVYNNVMDNLADRDAKLMQHTEILESEVNLRTQELVQARDQAINASRHKSEFLANISHELRTPLQAILGYSDIIKESLEDEGLDDFVEDIDRITHNGTHLLTLINGILDLSKIEAGKMDLNLTNIQVAEVIEKARDTLLPLMQQNRNELQIDIDDIEKIIRIDEIKLLQIILNLASNAGKFTKNGVVVIRARHSNDFFEVEVEDSGIGMDKDHLNLIFDPFRQIDGSTTREFEGTGLGLSITRRFCEVLGGHISVTSEKGKGSCFTARFPLPINANSNVPDDPTV